MCDQHSLRSACAYAQSDQNINLSLEYSMSVKLLTEHHLEFLSLKGGYTGSSESTFVKMPHCWKSRVTAQIVLPLTTDSPIFIVSIPQYHLDKLWLRFSEEVTQLLNFNFNMF